MSSLPDALDPQSEAESAFLSFQLTVPLDKAGHRLLAELLVQ